jgi:iron complex outermembrane recepter protein
MNLPLHSVKGRSSSYRRFAALFILKVLACPPAVAETTNSYLFNIQAENLSSALTQLAAQAGVEILFDPRLTNEIKTPSMHIRGVYDVSDLLDIFISATSLEYITSNKIIVVRFKKNTTEGLSSSGYMDVRQDKNAAPDEIVVTGTPGGSSLDKQALSFAVSTTSAQKIAQRAPQNTADIFKTIPGVWVESSGGVAGANIDVRGLPGGGDAPFVTLSINGMPVYPAATLSFMDNLALFRLDDTIERLEGLRGGPSTIYSNGQPGLTANFLLKEGEEQAEGGIKYTTSSYDLNRIDAWASGPLTDSLYYMLGGYRSISSGVRDTGFDSEQGYQFTGELTWRFEQGKINIFRRITDDHGTWYAPNNANLGASYSQLGPHNRLVAVVHARPNPEGADLLYNTDPDGNGPLIQGDRVEGGDGIPDPERIISTYDLANGRGWNGYIQGLSTDMVFNNWTAIERLAITRGNADTYSLLSEGEASTLGSLNDGKEGKTISGATVPSNAIVQLFGPWIAQKQIESLTNELTLNGTWLKNEFTIGYYFANWNATDVWSLGKQKYYEQKHDGELLSPASISNPCQSFEVITCDWSYDLQARGDATESSFYAAAKTSLERLVLDAGVRQSRYSSDYKLSDNIGTRALGDAYQLLSYTAAASWEFNEQQSMFVRLNSGFSLPKFDDYRIGERSLLNHLDLTTHIEQRELGYKLIQDDYSLFATAFYNHANIIPECNASGCESPQTQAVGIETEGTFTYGPFSLDLLATIQSAKLLNTIHKGNQVLRQPHYQMSFHPSYKIDNWQTLDVICYADILLVGNRYSGNDNSFVLPGFNKINVGLQATMNKTLFRLSIDNLTNKQGIDEGSRLNSSQTNVRYILPRTLRFSISHDF